MKSSDFHKLTLDSFPKNDFFEHLERGTDFYQKFKRSRGGKVVLLFYDDTPEKQKVKRVVSEIAIRYPWSTIFYSDT